MSESTRFMRTIGMRPIFDGPQVSVYEMRGGTHLIFQRFVTLGLAPSPIEDRPSVHHKIFTVREPAGHVITIFSSHASGMPT